jgi:hypothetical protein
MRIACLALIAACGGERAPATTPQVPVHEATPADPHAAVALRARADHALREDAPLDYERPFTAKASDRTATARLFGDACRAGDKHACIVEAQLRPLDARGQSYQVVAAACRAGDVMSCRALPLDDDTPRFADLPGAMSRRAECQKFDLPAPCSADALRAECTAGYPAACAELGAQSSPSAADDELFARFPQLSKSGCLAGIASECEKATQRGSTSEQLDIAQRLCDLRRDRCGMLAIAYRLTNDAAHEREALERSCEYGERWFDCIELGGGYLDSRFEEPVAGRGQALVDWACPKFAAHAGEAGMRRAPACQRANH